MKKYFIFLYVSFATSIFSQNIAFGPKLGANIIHLGKQSNLNYNLYSVRANIGANVEYFVNDHFSISADVLFSQKRKNYQTFENVSLFKTLNNSLLGGIVNVQDSSLSQITQFINDTVYGTHRGTVKLNYIEIPLLARFNYKGFSVGAGPYFAILVQAQTIDEFSQSSALLDIASNALDSIPGMGSFIQSMLSGMFPGYAKPLVKESSGTSLYSRLDAGFVIDLQYRFASKLYANARFTHGLLDYRKTPVGKRQANTVFQVGIGYSFGKGINAKSKTAKPIYDLTK